MEPFPHPQNKNHGITEKHFLSVALSIVPNTVLKTKNTGSEGGWTHFSVKPSINTVPNFFRY